MPIEFFDSTVELVTAATQVVALLEQASDIPLVGKSGVSEMHTSVVCCWDDVVNLGWSTGGDFSLCRDGGTGSRIFILSPFRYKIFGSSKGALSRYCRMFS